MSRARRRWNAFVVPTSNGLPNGAVLAAGLGLLAGVLVVLVATSINGTSSGAFYSLVYAGQDPALLFGQPNLIRTDEWNVQTVWAISQFQQGLPAVNATFPGGMDTTIPQDLPRLDWTVAFRPHLWGFLFMDVGHAQAWKWWLPVFGLAAAAYTFAVTLIPRRPVLSLTLAVGFTASPFFAWWLLQTTLWPVSWGFLVLAATLWALRGTSRRSLWIWAAIVAYMTVVMGMGIYVPFIIPVVVVVAAVAVGLSIEASAARGWPLVLRRAGSVVAGGIAAGGVLVLWLVTRWGTVSEFLSTAYPGERLESTGSSDGLRALAALFGSSFTNALRHAGTFLNGNASESATFFLPGVFLGVVVLWVAVQGWRASRRLPWGLLLGYGAILLLLAFIFVPGWDPIAHLLLLDRTTSGRARIGLGFGSMVLVIMLMARVSTSARPGWLVSLTGPIFFVLSQVGIALALDRFAPHLLAAAGVWWAYTAVGAVALVAVARGWRSVAGVALLVGSVAATYNVNPLYVGVFDLRGTEPSQTIEQLDDEDGGVWVGLGGNLPTALLLESGVTAYNGFQGAPGDEMWQAIDPEGRFEYEWNRLAGVSWVTGDGEPVVTNPYPDQIRVTFDACSDFAQDHVSFVLSDDSQIPSSTCLIEREHFDLNGTDLSVWEVAPAA